MTEYLFVFAQTHAEFRIPELRSISELHGFAIGFARYDDGDDDARALALAAATVRPFMVLALDAEEHARTLAARCVLVKSVYELYAQGASYAALHAANARAHARWACYVPATSFRFAVAAYNRRLAPGRQRAVIEDFAYMGFRGRIDLRAPALVLGCFEEYASDRPADGEFRQVYFGRLVAEGTARALVRRFDVRQRSYFGNTSMEAEMSLLMANQTQASPGKLIYDPFVGTGSTAYTTAHFGALFYGSDIDGRQMRGKGGGGPPGIVRAASQYGVAGRIVDLCTFDVTHHPWRCGALFDALVTDPPYGVRAGAKRLGRKKPRADPPPPRTHAHAHADTDAPYVPPTQPYELAALVVDLVRLARYLLRPRGLLVFFLPTVTQAYDDVDVDAALCDGMHVVANSLQDFGSWGRRLITIRKTTSDSYPPPTFDGARDEDAHVPAHQHFRAKYFEGFKGPTT